MKKKEILDAFGHNAIGLLQQAEAERDMDLTVLATQTSSHSLQYRMVIGNTSWPALQLL